MTSKQTIWVIGGTSNATEICSRLTTLGYKIIVSVTTDFGRQLSELPGVVVVKAMLNPHDMEQLIKEYSVDLIVDASHPFAVEVSTNAMRLAEKQGLKYLRYERQNSKFEGAVYVNDYEDVVAYLAQKEGNVLLTTGSKHVSRFMPLGAERLFARVLSTSDSVVLCEQAGLKPVSIIAMCGVGSVDLNVALMHEFSIRYLVTKESGAEGGLTQKLEAAKRAKVEVVIIQRPTVVYPEVFSDYDTLMARIEPI